MGREVLGLAGDSLFIERLNLAYKTADAVLQKKVFSYSEEHSGNGQSSSAIVDDRFLELAPEISKFDSSSFLSMNADPEQDIGWEYYHLAISNPTA